MENVPLEFDGEYLYSLNAKGIEVMDIQDSKVVEIENTMKTAKSVFCYNKYTKLFMSKKEDATIVLSKIVNK